VRRTLALLAAGALAASGLAGTELAGADHAEAAAKITWGDCTDPGLVVSHAQCGFLSVPLDHARPTGAKIKIAVSRMKATAPAAKRQGVMLVNPGGPGGEGLAMAQLRDVIPKGAGKYYDWIGFDPRGVGASVPAITCDANYNKGPRPDYVPGAQGTTLSAQEKKWLARSKAYAAACGKKYGKLLPHMHTTDTVKDMELLRLALGAQKINYYGFSYGTYLGQIYAMTYPTRVRRMVLDGNVDPRGIWYAAQLGQDRAFEKVIEQFFAWTARNDKTYALGTTAAAVRKRYNAELARLRKNGAVLGVGPSEWNDTFGHAGYAEFLWPATASAFASRVHHGDMREMNSLYQQANEPGDDNGFAVYNAVQCVDAAWPRSYTKGWRADAFATAAKAPFMTWQNVWYNTACIYWPAAPGKPVKIDGRKVAPFLMINTTSDGATPYSGALQVRKLFPRARLVAEKGATTHANSLGGNPCVDARLAAYLATGKLPARKAGSGADVVCARLPLPDPSPGAFAAGSDDGSEGGFYEGSSTSEPAPAPTPPMDQSLVGGIIGLLPDRGGRY
jgi:pimeloyl-ACP methyl ester carboxylesterase